MIILGLDPGYGRLGYAIFSKEEGGKEELLDYSCIETAKEQPFSQRILEISQKLTDIMEKYRPAVVATEKLYFTKNQKTALAVAETKGVISYLASKNKIKLVEYNPLEIKAAVCGHGRAGKEEVKKMVTMILKLDKPPKHDDTSDAIAAALTCFARRDF